MNLQTEMLAALRLHKAWADSERRGPDYGGQTRDTHPDGETIWRRWWEDQLSLCARAEAATDAAIARAEREAERAEAAEDNNLAQQFMARGLARDREALRDIAEAYVAGKNAERLYGIAQAALVGGAVRAGA